MDEGLIYEVKDADVKKAKETYKDLKLLKISLLLDDDREFQCIVKKPNNASISRYIQAITNASKQNKSLSQHHERFCFDCLVTPTSEKLMSIVEDKNVPLLPLSLANELIKGSGMSVDSKKKLL